MAEQTPAAGSNVRKLRGNANLFTEQAVDVFADMLFSMADPDEVLRKAGLTRKDLRRLEGDDEIAGHLETRVAPLLSMGLRLDPYDATIAPFIEAELKPHLDCIIRGAWQAVPYGYSVQEVVYRRTAEGRVGLAEVSEKPMEWFAPLHGGRLRYLSMTPRGLAMFQEVDTVLKFMLTVRQPTYRQPMGEALLSRAYWPWFLRSAGYRFWSRFLERTAGPLLIGATNGSTSALADTLMKAVQSGAVAVGAGDTVTSVGGGSDGRSYDMFCSRVERRLAKLILGQTLTSDTQGTGSQALGRVHDDVRKDRVESDLRLVRGTLQKLVTALTVLNFPGASPPSVELDAGRDLTMERTDRDAKLANAGMVRFTEQYFLNRYDLQAGEFEVIEPQAVPPQLQPSLEPAPDEGDDDDDAEQMSAGRNALRDRLAVFFTAAAASAHDHEPDDALLAQLAAAINPTTGT